MALDPADYPSQLDITSPAFNEPVGEADDQIRTAKRALNQGFPNVAGACTASHTELNRMDGITASTAELNIMDGVTATAAEINKTDGLTSTTAELNKLDGFTGTPTTLNRTNNLSSDAQTQLNAKMEDFTITDGDSTTTTITDGENLKFVEGQGIDVNFTNTGFNPDITIAGKTATTGARGVTYLPHASLANKGWWRDPNTGFTVQWGDQSVAGTTSTVIAFARTFSAVYTVVAGFGEQLTGATGVAAFSVGTSNFTARHTSSGSRVVTWCAYGNS